jgi:hypothetical protein
VRRHRGRWWGTTSFSGFQDRRKPEKVQMQNITQPFVKLTTANAALIKSFAESPEMLELANSSAQKYFELAQKTFGKAAASEAQADLIRRLTENYATFAQEYSQSLIGIAAEGAQQMQAAADRMTETTAAAVADATKSVKPARAK